MQPNQSLLSTQVVETNKKPAHMAASSPIGTDGIDPQIKALVSAMGEAETGPSSPEAYTKKGASGEYGRYQFLPDTYKARAGKYLGDANAAPTVENQNKIQYEWVKDMKNKGYNPAQIASMQNAGEGEPDAYRGQFKNGKPSSSTAPGGQPNSSGVQYDVPAYTKKVSEAYERLKGQQSMGDINQQQPEEEGSFIGDVGRSFGKIGSGIATAVGKGLEGQINPFSAGLQSIGAVAGGVGDLTDTALEHTPLLGSAYKGVKNVIGEVASAAAETETGQKLIQKGQEFAEKHPEAAGNIGAVGNIATAIPILKGASVAKSAVSQGTQGILKGSVEKAAATALKTNPSLNDVKAGIKKGLVKAGKHGPELGPDDAKQLSTQHVADLMREGKISKNASHSEIANATQRAADAEAMSLESRLAKSEIQNIVQPEDFQGLAERVMKRAGTSATSGENPAKTLLKVFEENLPDGKEVLPVDILKARRAVGQFIRENRGDWNQRGVLTGFKSARDAFWDESRTLLANLAPDVDVFKSLEKQTALYRVLDYVAPDVKKEIVDASKSTFMNRHPVVRGLLRAGKHAAIEGTGVGAALKILQ